MVDDSNISRAMKDNSKTTVIANLHRAGVKILQEGLERSNILAIAQNQNHSSEKRIGKARLGFGKYKNEPQKCL